LNQYIWIILFLIFVPAFGFFVPQFLVMIAAKKIIRNLRNTQTTNPVSAKFPKDIGIQQLSRIQRIIKIRRDDRPKALDELISSGIIKTTEDGRIYLSEERLLLTRWKNL
jgi:hypothetical protein